MTSASTDIKIDPELKEQAQALFDSLGLSLSAAVNIFLRQAVREQAIPFRIGLPQPTAATLRAVRDARRGVGVSRGFSSVHEQMEDLDADD